MRIFLMQSLAPCAYCAQPCISPASGPLWYGVHLPIRDHGVQGSVRSAGRRSRLRSASRLPCRRQRGANPFGCRARAALQGRAVPTQEHPLAWPRRKNSRNPKQKRVCLAASTEDLLCQTQFGAEPTPSGSACSSSARRRACGSALCSAPPARARPRCRRSAAPAARAPLPLPCW
jgi:hypothetical protein